MKKACSLFLILAFVFSFLPKGLTSPSEVIIDHFRWSADINEQDIPEFSVSSTGNWVESGVAGTDHSGTTGSLYTLIVGAWAQWTPSNIVAGNFEVYVFNTYRPSGWDTKAQYEVVSKIEGCTVKNTYNINQQTASGSQSGWVKLGGVFSFEGNGGEYIKLTKINTASGTYTQADRVKFVPVPATSDNADLSLLSVMKSDISGNYSFIPLAEPFASYKTNYNAILELNATNYSIFACSLNTNAKIFVDDDTGNDSIIKKDYTPTIGLKKHKISVQSEDNNTIKNYYVTIDLGSNTNKVIVDDYQNTTTFSKSADQWAVSTNGTAVPEPTDANITSPQNFYTGVPGAWAKWTPNLTSTGAGYYNVYLWRSVHVSATDLSLVLKTGIIEVDHNGITEVRSASMNTLPPDYIYVGKFYFNASGGESLKLSKPSTDTSSGQLRASVAKFVKTDDLSDNSTLSSLLLNSQETELLNNDFVKGVAQYQVDSLTTSIQLSALPINKDAKVAINGQNISDYSSFFNYPLQEGNNVLYITITSVDSTKSELYKLIVKRGTFVSESNIISTQYFGLQKDDNGFVDVSSVSQGSIRANLRFDGLTNDSSGLSLILAKYRKTDNSLVGLEIKSFNIDASCRNDISTNAISLGEDYSNYNLHIMLFDNLANISPIINSIKY